MSETPGGGGEEPAPRTAPAARDATVAERLETLLRLSQALTATLDLDEVLAEFVSRANELSYADSTVLSVYEPDEDVVRTLVQVKADGEPQVRPDGETYSLADYPATRKVLQSQSPAQVHLSDEDYDRNERDLLSANGYRSLLMLPLVGRGDVVGLMEVYDVGERVFEEDIIEFCRGLCAIVGVAMRNANLYAEMERLATHDGLTGLANRGMFEEQLQADIARSDRSGEPLALLLMDLDGLKTINDGWGHAAGDAALRTVARALRSTVRSGDLACRIGGDEFAVILPGARRRDAFGVAARTRAKLAEMGSYRFSGGIAEHVPDGGNGSPNATGLYSAADRASYRAKRAGGGKVL